MTVQEQIDNVVKMVKDGLKMMPAEEREEIIRSVEDIGYQWQNANACHKASLVAVGMMLHDDQEEVDFTDEKQIASLEDEGASAIMKEITLPGYAELVGIFLIKANALSSVGIQGTEE